MHPTATRSSLVSSSTALLTEATRSLAVAGMLEVLQGDGTYVRSHSDTDPVDIPEPRMAAHRSLIDAIGSTDPTRADETLRTFMSPILLTLERLLNQ